MYRAYSADQAIEIVPFEESHVGYAARDVLVDWYPKATATEPEGMRVLIKLPRDVNISPAPFIRGTNCKYSTTVQRVNRKGG